MDNIQFWQAAIIAGIALIGPVVAGVVALLIAKMQVDSQRRQSVRDARREKIEEAVGLLMPIPTLLGHSLVDWIEAGQQAQCGLSTNDPTLINASSQSIQVNPINFKIPDRAGRAAMLAELYMPDCRNEISIILTALGSLTDNPRAKGLDSGSAPILARELLIEYSDATMAPMWSLISKAKALINE